MVVVKIKSGLGNQMFQYALGRRLSLDWNDELKFDFSWFNNIKNGETPRKLEIDKFNVILPKANESEIAKATPNFFAKTAEKVLGRLDRNYFFQFHSDLLKRKKLAYLDGYFQSYKYIQPIRDVLLKDFVLKNSYSVEAQMIKNEIETAGQSVAIHIRRGDYVTTCKDWNGLCNVVYYEKALSQIQKKYPDVKLFIFSDDIDWAQKNLKFQSPMVFVSRPVLNDVEEMLLMSLCKHQIIANSTFGWWAAWLNQNNEKIIVAPSRWLLAANIDTRDLLPPSWIKL